MIIYEYTVCIYIYINTIQLYLGKWYCLRSEAISKSFWFHACPFLVSSEWSSLLKGKTLRPSRNNAIWSIFKRMICLRCWDVIFRNKTCIFTSLHDFSNFHPNNLFFSHYVIFSGRFKNTGHPNEEAHRGNLASVSSMIPVFFWIQLKHSNISKIDFFNDMSYIIPHSTST